MSKEAFDREKLTVGPLRWLPSAYRAITLPPFGIWIRDTVSEEDFCGVLKHELVHWDQWRRYGTFGYYWRYFTGWVVYGYYDHPMEIEAYERSGVR